MLPKQASLFDLDGTLLKVNSSFCFGKYLYQQGFFSLFQLLQLATISVLHKIGFVSIESVHHSVFKKIFRGRCSKQVEQFADQFVETYFNSMLYSPAIDRLKQAQSANHFVAILSSSPDFIVKRFVQKFEVLHCESSIYAVDSNGLYSHIEHLVEGQVKAAWVTRAIEESLVGFEETTAYTDSDIDLPFLLSCGTKVIVNPTRRLRAIGLKNHWEII
ncbi:MAG: HAD-IB family phosphatase [Parachlamydiaceae bacterium]|nr:HAD-IB family phosphatase [Parachlamydiaceae bacterium]